MHPPTLRASTETVGEPTQQLLQQGAQHTPTFQLLLSLLLRKPWMTEGSHPLMSLSLLAWGSRDKGQDSEVSVSPITF